MGSQGKEPGRKLPVGLIAAVILVIAAVAAMLLWPRDPDSGNPAAGPAETAGAAGTLPTDDLSATAAPVQSTPDETEPITETDAPIQDTEPEADSVEFPVELEDGRIRVESLFQFSGLNPDADNQDAADVAAIQLRNTSDRYLARAAVTAVLADGSERTFLVEDLPAGAAVMAFSLENEVLFEEDLCTEVFADADFEEPQEPDGVEVWADGFAITLTNASGKDLYDLNVYYRDVFNDQYFGGKAYITTIDTLAAGESVTVTAEKSLLGMVSVVRVAAG